MESYPHTVPAGLIDESIEFFVNKGEVVFLQNGQLYPFSFLPIEVAKQLKDAMDADPKAIKGLALLGISQYPQTLYQFVFCRFGGNNPLADVEDQTIRSEYWDCHRRPCPADGLLCRLPDTPNGKLTPHETLIIRAVGNDLLNKEIASNLNVSVDTVNKTCKKIAGKIGCLTKSGIAAFGAKNNIL